MSNVIFCCCKCAAFCTIGHAECTEQRQLCRKQHSSSSAAFKVTGLTKSKYSSKRGAVIRCKESLYLCHVATTQLKLSAEQKITELLVVNRYTCCNAVLLIVPFFGRQSLLTHCFLHAMSSRGYWQVHCCYSVSTQLVLASHGVTCKMMTCLFLRHLGLNLACQLA